MEKVDIIKTLFQFNFFTLANPDEFRTATIINKLKEKKNFNYHIYSYQNFLHALKSILFLRKTKIMNSRFKNIDIVMYPSHVLAVILKILRKNYLVLDAGWSLSEGEISSRGNFGFLYWRFAFYYLIDFLTAHSADLIFLESESQKNYYARKFLVNKMKCQVIYTGVDEKKFSTHKRKLHRKFVVIFRGKYNNEAGLEVLGRSSFDLNDLPIRILVFAPGIPKTIKFASNTQINNKFLSKNEIAELLQSSDLTLGQLQNHDRLNRTIPHKAYESAYLGRPYLTARSEGILEIFSENREILCFTAGDSVDLSASILNCYKNRENLNSLGLRMKKRYMKEYSQEKLAKKFLTDIMRGVNE